MHSLDNLLKRAESRQNNINFTEEERERLARYGAAYRVVFERLCPDQCGPAEWSKLSDAAEDFRTWAVGVGPQYREAYERAIVDVVARAAARMENMRRAMHMGRIYEDIPKPPL